MGKVSLDLFSVGVRKLISELNKLLGQGKRRSVTFCYSFLFQVHLCTYKNVLTVHMFLWFQENWYRSIEEDKIS